MEGKVSSKDENSIDSSEANSKALKRKISLSGCETCDAEEAKYRCPRCMKYSCSLFCVKKHKTDTGCCGIRDKTAFLSVGKFDEIQLLSDYRFLEDTGRTVDCASRDITIRRPTSNKFLNFMKNRARKYNIDLKILPIGFTKRRENSTFFHKKEQRFFWHLKLVFPQSHAEYTEKRVPDNRTLEEVLKPYLHSTESDPVVRQKLKAYMCCPFREVKMFMKVANRKQNSVRYSELDSNKTLLENLRNKTIIEYPTIHVVLKDYSKDYIVLGQESTETSVEKEDGSNLASSEEEGEIREGAN
uniref:Box C/D snoRNA protein 1 n=1 Tax=Latimeria chalumnae TaxID=7897 RepID=H3BCV8_LATCH